MPIQFRCAHCDQLLGIARRKAGTIISCPTCNGRVIVPRLPEASDVETSGPQEKPDDLLEAEDFDALLQPPASAKSVGTATGRPPSSVIPAAPPLVFSDPGARALTVPPAAPRAEKSATSQATVKKPGVYLSPSTTVWIVVLGICLLVIAFLAGCVVGHFVWVRPAPVKPKNDEEVSIRVGQTLLSVPPGKSAWPTELASAKDEPHAVHDAIERRPVEGRDDEERAWPAA